MNLSSLSVMDMLRFQKFTVGPFWCGEFGCSENKTYFENLIKYSPLHNVRLPSDNHTQYPAVLVQTSDHDDRVVPLHSYKYIAELQHTIGCSPRQVGVKFPVFEIFYQKYYN
jgi:prolyl oligopeptidase